VKSMIHMFRFFVNNHTKFFQSVVNHVIYVCSLVYCSVSYSWEMFYYCIVFLGTFCMPYIVLSLVLHLAVLNLWDSSFYPLRVG
jgi:hypothetical protein